MTTHPVQSPVPKPGKVPDPPATTVRDLAAGATSTRRVEETERPLPSLAVYVFTASPENPVAGVKVTSRPVKVAEPEGKTGTAVTEHRLQMSLAITSTVTGVWKAVVAASGRPSLTTTTSIAELWLPVASVAV